MMLKLPERLRTRTAVSTVIGVLLISGVTIAQTQPMEPIQWDKRRLDQLDRNVRRLERALTQRNAAGQPVLVEPDPEVIALQGRVQVMDQRLQDVESSLRRVNAELERLSFQLDESSRENTTLRNRVRDAENRVTSLENAAREAAELSAPIVANSPTGNAAGDLTAAVRLSASDSRRGARALETLVVTWPDAPEAKEASYRLGDLAAAQGDLEQAVQDYAVAIQGWPRTPWAGEAVVKLATALEATGKNRDACGALGEFTRRYAEGASAALRTRAGEVRTRAGCR